MPRLTAGPWPNGVVSAMGDGAVDRQSLRDSMGFVGGPVGSLSWVFQGQEVASFGTYTPKRVMQWLDDYVQLESRPTSQVIVDDGTTQTTLVASGRGYGAIYDDKLFLALDDGIDPQPARVYPNPASLTQYCFLSNNQLEGWVSNITGAGPYTIEFDNTGDYIRPTRTVAADEPLYVLWEVESGAGVTTAVQRAVVAASAVWVGNVLTSVNVTADPTLTGLAVGGRVRLFMGDDTNATTIADSLMKPTEFFVYRERLFCVWDDMLWWAGYPGRGDVPITIAPINVSDPFFWSGLAFLKVGDPSRGPIRQCVVVGDAIVVYREKQVCVVYGYVPADATIDNNLQWDVISDKAGIEAYGAACLVRSGQAAFSSGKAGFFVYENGRIGEIDSSIRNSFRYRQGYDLTAGAGDYLAAMDVDDNPDLVALETKNRPAGILNQFPTLWLYYLPTQSWWPVVRATMDDYRKITPFDNPGWGGGICSIEHNGQVKLAIGHAGGLWTLLDNDPNDPAITDCHVQGMVTHAGDDQAELMQFLGAVVHTRQPFEDVEMFVTVPADGYNEGPGKDTSNRGEILRTSGDLAIYEVFAQEGPLTPRISLSLGYFGDALLAGMDANQNAYSDLTASAQATCQKFWIDGRVDRIDVFCHSVTTFDVVIYAVDEVTGLPDDSTEVRRFTVTTPKGGMKSVATSYWYSVEFGPLGGWRPARGYYYVGVIGTATFRSYSAPSTLYNADGTEKLAAAALALRVVQEVGGPVIVKEVTNAVIDVMGQMGAGQ